MKTILLVLALLLVQPALALEIGAPAPNVYGRTLDNQLFRLSKLQGPVVLNFFWVECAPCVKEMPELAHLEKQYPGVRFIAVHVEDEERETIQRFVDGLDAHPETVVKASPRVKDAYRIRVLPHTVIIDDGKVHSVLEGYTDKSIAMLRQRLNTL